MKRAVICTEMGKSEECTLSASSVCDCVAALQREVSDLSRVTLEHDDGTCDEFDEDSIPYEPLSETVRRVHLLWKAPPTTNRPANANHRPANTNRVADTWWDSPFLCVGPVVTVDELMASTRRYFP
jgi:hypothetical protein